MAGVVCSTRRHLGMLILVDQTRVAGHVAGQRRLHTPCGWRGHASRDCQYYSHAPTSNVVDVGTIIHTLDFLE